MIEDEVLVRLVHKYAELAEKCYRVSVSRHDERGRFRKGHRRPMPDSALLKKVDLDAALAQVYRRFFGTQEGAEKATSTSNRRFQGSDTLSSPQSWAETKGSRAEKSAWANGSRC